jgi:hypothetical protein
LLTQHDDYYEAPKKSDSYYEAPKKSYYKEEKHDDSYGKEKVRQGHTQQYSCKANKA